MNVMLGDVCIQIQSKMRPLSVEVTESSVNAIITFCRNHVRSNMAALKKDQEACPETPKKASFVMPTDACPAIQGKVTWQPSHQAWCVHCKDSKGVTSSSRVRVVVQETSTNFLKRGGSAKDSFHTLRRQRYIDAIIKWNETDASTRPRIDVPQA